MTEPDPPPKREKTVAELAEEFRVLDEQAKEIQAKMADLAEQLAERRANKPPGTKTESW